MIIFRRHFLHLAAGLASLPVTARLALGESYPSRPVRIIVATAAAGGTDLAARLIAIEPNPYMHARLRRAARRRGVDLEIRSVVGERIDLPDGSAEAVISSLVLCTVSDPDAVLAEIRRILRPGGRFSFAEHVVARRRTPTRWSQRVLRRPWAWVFEGCSCERDLTSVIASAGFASVEISHYRIHSPFVPFNTQIALRIADSLANRSRASIAGRAKRIGSCDDDATTMQGEGRQWGFTGQDSRRAHWPWGYALRCRLSRRRPCL